MYLYNEKTNKIHIKGYCSVREDNCKVFNTYKQALQASGGNAILCLNCKAKKDAIEKQRHKQRQLREQKKKEREIKEAELREQEKQKWLEEARRLDEQRQQKKQQIEAQKDEEIKNSIQKLHLEESHQEEASKHNMGCLLICLGFLFLIIPCFMHGGTLSIVLFCAGLGLVAGGYFPWAGNRSASKIKKDREMAKAIVSMWAIKAQAGKLSLRDVDTASSALGLDSIQKHNQAKKDAAKIVKGAVIGGVVAGETGAVIGATIAKNKIDNEKKQYIGNDFHWD